MEAWLRTHEVEETTRKATSSTPACTSTRRSATSRSARSTLDCWRSSTPSSAAAAQRCDGRLRIEHRVDGPHECRTVKHRRGPGRPPLVATRRTTAPRPAARSSSASRTLRRRCRARRSAASTSQSAACCPRPSAGSGSRATRPSSPASRVSRRRSRTRRRWPQAAQIIDAAWAAGRGVGHAGLAGHGDRHAPRRAARAALVRHRPGRRGADGAPQLRAGRTASRREGHQDPPDAPPRARSGDRRGARRAPRRATRRCAASVGVAPRSAGVLVLLSPRARPALRSRAA